MSHATLRLSRLWSAAPNATTIQAHGRIELARYAVGLVMCELIGSLLLAYVLSVTHHVPFNAGLVGATGFVMLWGLATSSQELYRKTVMMATLRRQLWKSAVSIGLVFGPLLMVVAALTQNEVFEDWLIHWSIVALIWVWAVRFGWHRLIRVMIDNGACVERAAVLVGSPQPSVLFERIEQETLGLRIVLTAPIPKPTENWLEEVVRNGQIDHVFIAGFDGCVNDTNIILGYLARCAVAVTLLPDMGHIEATVRHVDVVVSQPMLHVNVAPLSATDALIKRAEDIVVASLALVLLAPALIIVAIAIKLDSPGPVFFKQWRLGYHDRKFLMWKFRSMYHERRDEHAIRQTGRDDDRVTKIGRLLRRTSIDELPQLINVLLGEMSIIGPRPHALGMTAANRALHEVIADYSARHRVKPGMTGWAQVCGSRGEVATEDGLHRRVMLDCYYIENWSPMFDLWIILRTIWMILMTRDAY